MKKYFFLLVFAALYAATSLVNLKTVFIYHKTCNTVRTQIFKYSVYERGLQQEHISICLNYWPIYVVSDKVCPTFCYTYSAIQRNSINLFRNPNGFCCSSEVSFNFSRNGWLNGANRPTKAIISSGLGCFVRKWASSLVFSFQ